MSIFEQVRDEYFIDPRDPDCQNLVDGATMIIDGMADSDSIPAEVPTDPIGRAAHGLVTDFQGARRFDHLAVAQLHPTDNQLGVLANLASTLWNNNTIIGEVSPVETGYENDSVKWMIENVAGYDPENASGSLVSGGTSANFTAMTVARHRLEAEGWDGRSPVKLFASEMAHYSITKAARLLAPGGLIEVDQVPLEPGGYRLDPAELKDRVERAKYEGQRIMGIVAVAGETETGLVDDLDAIAEIAGENGIYLHVDGAYGAPYRMSKVGSAFEAVSDSDSLTCDPHKYLYVPYSSGAIMFKNAADHSLLEALNSDGGAYMFKDDEAKALAHEGFKHGGTYLGRKRIEGSMGGQAAAALYTTIKHLGRDGLAALLDHNLEMTALFTDEMLGADGLKPSFEPQLNSVCIEPSEAGAKGNDKRTEFVSANLERDYGIYLSTTSLPNRDHTDGAQKVFRFVATHPHTNADDVRYIADSLKKAWKESQ